VEIMRDKLHLAASEGQLSFHLSWFIILSNYNIIMMYSYHVKKKNWNRNLDCF
jgi:hypothetical protein